MSEKRTGKYLKYALGEILLVMIGILLALQVNNWNEGRKAISTEKTYLKSIYSELNDDISKIKANNDLLSNHYSMGLEVLKAMDLKDHSTKDSIKIATYLGWNLSQIIPVNREDNTWDKFRVLGYNTLIIDDSLTYNFNKFYSKYDQQIERFNQLPKKLRQELRELTGYCHNSKGLEFMREKGVELAYGASSPETRKCILSITKIKELVGAIMVTCIVNTKIYDELEAEADNLLSQIKKQYEFITP
jgi:hypothetical protein